MPRPRWEPMAARTYANKPGKTSEPSSAPRAQGSVPWAGRSVDVPRVQAKLEVGPANDPFEREADAVADRIMRMPTSPPEGTEGVKPAVSVMRAGEAGTQDGQQVRRPCDECEERKEQLRRDTEPGAHPTVGSGFEMELDELRRRRGEPLPEDTQQFMETRFGHSFANVRVHAGSSAAALAKNVRAKAFTVGSDVVFGRGEYQPHTNAGQRLLAHELVHTLQQAAPSRYGDGNGIGPCTRAVDGIAATATSRGNDAPPLTEDRSSFEPRFGFDFSEVRAHVGTRAAEVSAAREPPPPKQTWQSLEHTSPHRMIQRQVSRRERIDQPPGDLACEAGTPGGRTAGTAIMFQQDSAVIEGAARTEALDLSAQAWRRRGRERRITVHGYASAEGTAAYNWRLSCARALAVRESLVAHGINRSLIRVVAHGETDGFSDAELMANRRAQILIGEPTLPAPPPRAPPGIPPVPGTGGTGSLRDIFDRMSRESSDFAPLACRRRRVPLVRQRGHVPEDVVDAFGHCWIGCQFARETSRGASRILGGDYEWFREYLDPRHHNSYEEDQANQRHGRTLSIDTSRTCTQLCTEAAELSDLDLHGRYSRCFICSEGRWRRCPDRF